MLKKKPSNLRQTGALTAFVIVIAVVSLSRMARGDNLLEAGAIDYSIMSTDGTVTLGSGRFTIERVQDGIVLHGESRYSTGQYDTESDRLSPGTPDTLPTLEKFEHLFYNADGVQVRSGHADLTSSFASCVDTSEHLEKSQRLSFPADTWAGASVLIPIQRFLQKGESGTLNTSVFTCAPAPAVYSVSIAVAPYTAGSLFVGPIVQVTVKPHFGWYDVLIAPFVPKLNAWFDPTKGWSFEGVEIARYYKGPQIIIVRSGGKNANGAPALPSAIPGATAKQSP